MSESSTHVTPYRAMTLAELAGHLRSNPPADQWRLVAEFLEEYRWEPAIERLALLADEPGPTGDERWDVFLAALAEWVAFYQCATRLADQYSL